MIRNGGFPSDTAQFSAGTDAAGGPNSLLVGSLLIPGKFSRSGADKCLKIH